MTRPSGATLFVRKTFKSGEDCEGQYRLLCALPDTVALKPFALDFNGGVATSYDMPLALGAVGNEDLYAVLATLGRMWHSKIADSRAASRAEYHDYVRSRTLAFERFSMGQRLWMLCDQLFSRVKDKSVREPVVVHGDAIISNFVQTHFGPRVIDPSTRPCVPEVELDISKLWFSALGFDVKSEDRRAELFKMVELSSVLTGSDFDLLRYHLAAHAVRVYSKEPPRDNDRIVFFRKVAENVAD